MSEQQNMTRDEAFLTLEEMGAVKALVHFSGGNDEGGSDYIQILLGDGEKKDIHEYVWGDSKQTAEETELAVALAEPVYGAYGSFAGDFSVSGVVEWDVAKREVKMSGEEQEWVPVEERLV